ncbi:MAG: T9SS type A sorting domain-containing protein [Ignavibacteria bacterium]|nr:T9SS type A sorting domain-containing protein [Ignavibacteria bacterium]
MKTIVISLLFVFIFPVSSQSVLTLDAGTTLGVLTGTDFCANIITGNGILYGSGNICGGLVSVQQNTSEIPASFELFQNYPNPFNPVTLIKYQIPANSFVSLKLYDQLGREALEIFEGEQNAGYYSIQINAGGLSSGIYYLKVSYGGNFKAIKISLIK